MKRMQTTQTTRPFSCVVASCVVAVPALLGGCVAELGDATHEEEEAVDTLAQEVSYDECDPGAGKLLYLDGACNGRRVKARPGRVGRDNARWRQWQCPVRASVPAEYLPATASLPAIEAQMDLRALGALNLPAGLSLTLINVRRDSSGRPHYRYFSTTERDARESWSTSKFMAIAAAGARAREVSGGRVGLTSTTASGEPVGDLVSWVHNYDRGGRYESNALARYFLDVGGRDWSRSLVREWIGAGTSSLGANYGPFYPDGVSRTWREGGHGQALDHTREAGGDKRVSMLATAEFLKRLVMHREDAATRMPGFRADAQADSYWRDLEVLFYGRPGHFAGGMQDDTAIYLESALDMQEMERRAPGEWRIFSKLGYGISSARSRHELVYAAYACLPDLARPAWGKEMIIAANYSRPAATADRVMDRQFQGAIARVVGEVMSGQIDSRAAPVDTRRSLRDVEGHWSAAFVRGLASRGLIAGYPDGTFRPDRTLSRAELAALVVAALDPQPDARCTDRDFSDLRGHWGADVVRRAARSCFIAGFPDGTFGPDQPVTKAQVYVTLAAGLGLRGGDAQVLSRRFVDGGRTPEWARPAVASALGAGLVTAFPMTNRLEPGAAATRGEAAVAIYQALVHLGRVPRIESRHVIR